MIVLNLKLKRVVVIKSEGTDVITLYPDLDTPFPEMEYKPSLKMEARKGYGVEYCKNILGIEPEIIKV